MIKRVLAILICMCISISSHAIRAGLDFTFKLNIGGVERVATCDICTYLIKEREIYFQTRTVNSNEGYVNVVFYKETEKDKIDYTSIVSFEGVEGEGQMYQVIKVLEGQTLKIMNTDIKFTLIDAYGPGCPKGAIC